MLSAGRGFTLLELMIAVAVAAILVTVAAPGMSDLIRRQQASSGINELVYSMRLARSEAVTRKRSVGVCVGDGDQCLDSNDWHRGWLVFVDIDDDGDCGSIVDGSCSDGGRVLHRGGVAGGFEISATGPVSSNGLVSFDHRGFAPNHLSTFTLCDARGTAEPRAFTLQMSGRIRKQAPDTDACS